jgi:hypothetical protein
MVDRKTAKNFFRQISTGEVKIDVCDLSALSLEKYKVFTKKDSSSESVIAFGKIAGNVKTAVKMFMATRENDGIAYEAEIYRFITEKIINRGLSPNFISYLGFGVCKLSNFSGVFDDYEFAKTQFETKFKKEGTYYKTYGKSSDTIVGVLLTKVPTGINMTYEKFKKNLNISDYDKSAVFVQLCCAILLMEKFCLTHNDLYDGNILINESPEEKVICYNIGKHPVSEKTIYYEVKTRYTAYLFDWDRSFCDIVGDNPNLDKHLCIRLAECNQYIEKADFFRFFCDIAIRRRDESSVAEFARGIITKGKSSLYRVTIPELTEEKEEQELFIFDDELARLRKYDKNSVWNSSKTNGFYRLTAEEFFTVFPSFLEEKEYQGVEQITLSLIKSSDGYYINFNARIQPRTMSKYYPSVENVLFRRGEWIENEEVLSKLWKNVFGEFLKSEPSKDAKVYVIPEKIGTCKKQGKSSLEILYEPSVTYLSLREKSPDINVKKLWKFFRERSETLKQLKEYCEKLNITYTTLFNMATLCDIFITKSTDVSDIKNCWKVALALQREKKFDISNVVTDSEELDHIFLIMRPPGLWFKNIYSEYRRMTSPVPVPQNIAEKLYNGLVSLEAYGSGDIKNLSNNYL